MSDECSAKKYRHEYKYLCDGVQNAILKARVRGILKTDCHASKEGCYRIRSLYFDTPQDSCYYANEGGEGERTKYRIRIYNEDARHIVLEKKSKTRQMTLKQSCVISKSICCQMMSGMEAISVCGLNRQQSRIICEMREKAMRPVVIVEYVRYPFVGQSGNVRVTFDEAVSSSNDLSNFLEKQIVRRPIMEKGMWILEVKWDELLPAYLKDHIQLETLQWSTFSKYYLCRKYNTYGGIRI